MKTHLVTLPAKLVGRAPMMAALALLIAVLSSLTVATPVAAQEKRALDHEDYARWNRIQSDELSRDGRWLAYRLVPGEGDATLVVRSLQGDRSLTLDRGAQPRFTADARYLVALIEPMESVVDSLRAEGARGDAMPDDSLAIVDLADFSVTRVADVMSFRLPEDAGAWMAYRLEATEDDDREEEREEAEAGSAGGASTDSEEEEAPRLDD
ncbi:MAG: hypothetical protein R3253_10195, partial [Longimicrobiales bacterium]|nr:hypothetical protein [Longimicrobiales bacterium]